MNMVVAAAVMEVDMEVAVLVEDMEVALEEVVDTEEDTAVVLEVATAVDLEVATAVDLEEEVDMAAVVALVVVTEEVDLMDMAILEADMISVEMIMALAVMAIVYHLILVAGKYRILLNLIYICRNKY